MDVLNKKRARDAAYIAQRKAAKDEREAANRVRMANEEQARIIRDALTKIRQRQERELFDAKRRRSETDKLRYKAKCGHEPIEYRPRVKPMTGREFREWKERDDARFRELAGHLAKK